MSGRALRVVGAQDTERRVDEPGWLEWLRARLDPAWRGGEWDGMTLLFTGDLDSARTAAWPCRTPGLPDGDAPPVGALRRLPPGPGEHGPALGGLRLGATGTCHPPAAARRLLGARL